MFYQPLKFLMQDNAQDKILATLKDISQRVSIAPSTISRLLNGDPTLSISAGKKEEIHNVVKELGYISPKRGKKKALDGEHQPTRTLPTSVIQELELVVVNFLTPSEEINDPYFTSIRVGIQDRCYVKQIPIRSIHRDQLQAHSYLLNKAIAVIAVGHFRSDEIKLMYSHNRNLIFVDSNPLGSRSDAVVLDRDAAAQEVVENMIKCGVQRPAFIGNAEERLHQFRLITKQHGCYEESLCKISKEYCIESGYKAMMEMLRQPITPDVVYAGTDMVAVGVYRAIYEHGLSIPEDIKVIGFNDIPSAQHMSPSLTTMRLYPFEMGKEAVNLYLELVEGRKVKKTIYFGHEFIWRDSFIKP
jgi:LacI family transcriptional regulator